MYIFNQAPVNVQIVKINCMTVSEPKAIYRALLEHFEIEAGAFETSKTEPFRTLEKAFTLKSSPIDNDKKAKKKNIKPEMQFCVFIIVYIHFAN